MLLRIPDVLSADEVSRVRETLARAPWAAGRATAGEQSATVKNNEQLPEESEESRLIADLVLYALDKQQTFFSAALPKRISPPLCNRYGGATNTYGNHVDSAVRYTRTGRVRTDISCTLFLSAPEEYEGGELVLEDPLEAKRIKLKAGDLILYPGNYVHRVEPVTRGFRLACFFWVESMVRSAEQRRHLFEMDRNLIQLRSTVGETDPVVVGLTGAYHNLLRMWADV